MPDAGAGMIQEARRARSELRLDDARQFWTEAKDLYAAAGVREGVVESEARLRQLRGG
jgi:hypothetical protein